MVKLTESAVYIRTKCSIENVKKLNLWGCGIDDISICEKMQMLEILSLSVNDVKTLRPLKNCKNLKEIYLRKNQIESFDELEYLRDLKNLKVLWIDENPCVKGIGNGENDVENEEKKQAEYRRKVAKMLPQLEKLDDKPITSSDLAENPLENLIDDTVPECDMHTSMYSTRSTKASQSEDLMTRSLYVPSTSIPTRILPSQFLHFGDTSDEEKPKSINRSISVEVAGIPMTEETHTVYLNNPSSNTPILQMSQSMYSRPFFEEGEPQSSEADDEWNDFSFEEDRQFPPPPSRMHQSMYCENQGVDHFGPLIGQKGRPGYGRSISMPRRRTQQSQSRGSSMSPAREHRLSKIMSAVSVLLDELDADSLRHVVDEAQRRIKKQR
ncbi:unnamed protein product [Caenorhabditis angaria]|uniref:U2A'/phosphoprotein 32 family A C-terminal domain-containing protein n=1 Tax=Caenorhabditis angaria TaxID=860376 RepID=A0A9P1IH39_9PELO|nr:unnamed protein product [Caenorhabditis angaria]